jgi:hypothetical protein
MCVVCVVYVVSHTETVLSKGGRQDLTETTHHRVAYCCFPAHHQYLSLFSRIYHELRWTLWNPNPIPYIIYTLLKKIKGTLKHNVTPSQSHFCEIKLST